MAGVKGRSGGARKNAGGARPNTGGARPGAGRKPKKSPANLPEATVELEPQPQGGSRAPKPNAESPIMDGAKREPLEFLELVLNEPGAPLKDRIRAAIAAAQYKHTKRGDGGKKDDAADKAKKAGAGRFSAGSVPLALVTKRR